MSLGIADQIGTEIGIVRNDDDVVFGHAHVRLDGRDADRERLAERCQRVLRREPACAAMALEVEGEGGDREEGEEY